MNSCIALEDLTGTLPRSRNNYHTAAFRNYADSVGIPCSVYGAEQGIRAPSPFLNWARQNGLKEDGTVGLILEGSSSSVAKQKRAVWKCKCPSNAAVSVMVASGSELEARCERCRELFEKLP